MKIEIPEIKRKWSDSIILKGVNQYNLTDLDVEFPLNTLTVITGVSGSGKSTLVKEVLKPALANFLGIEGQNRKNLKEIKVSTQSLKKIEFIDQNPIGKSSRSNPATYIKAYDEIRLLFAKQDLSKVRKYTSGFFSFNVEGGRCEHCKGEGEVTVEMQFMADVYLECEHCKGFRFKKEILDVQVGGKNIAEILELSVTEAISFFHENKAENISRKLEPLEKVGLGYVKLGQSSNTLSGGEAQRIKLGSFLSKGKSYEKTLFIFDEPTTGLHFHDIKKLLDSFYALIEKGHSVICIEHNLDVIKCSDWVIDLGPGGGNKGGNIMFTGDTEGLLKCKSSETGKFLKMKLSTNYNLNNPVE